MTPKILIRLISAGLALSSCQFNSKTGSEPKSTEPASLSGKNSEGDSARLFYGSWIQPDPINKNEVQGFTLRPDSTAESINMYTLLYKKWWLHDNKLVLVMESIGNKTSFIDTVGYEVNKINNQELVLKDRELIVAYRKQ